MLGSGDQSPSSMPPSHLTLPVLPVFASVSVATLRMTQLTSHQSSDHRLSVDISPDRNVTLQKITLSWSLRKICWLKKVFRLKELNKKIFFLKEELKRKQIIIYYGGKRFKNLSIKISIQFFFCFYHGGHCLLQSDVLCRSFGFWIIYSNSLDILACHNGTWRNNDWPWPLPLLCPAWG